MVETTAFAHWLALCYLTAMNRGVIFTSTLKFIIMKAIYEITSVETGTVLLKKRKIAKALRRWLRENGRVYSCKLCVSRKGRGDN